jgi:hypothetical protein
MSSINTIGEDEYAVYNGRERPGIGRDYLGHTYYSCFTVSLKRAASGKYDSYLFSDFIRHYNRYTLRINKGARSCNACFESNLSKESIGQSIPSGVCNTCIAQHKILDFPTTNGRIDRSAVYKKFSRGEAIDESSEYYCPLIHKVLLESEIESDDSAPSVSHNDPRAIWVCWSSGWDDNYLFEFKRLSFPQDLQICPIYKTLMFSQQFVSTKAEQRFLEMWLMSTFQSMEKVRQAGRKVYFEEPDFSWGQSKLFGFIFPIPQVWVEVIPKPPPGFSWEQWMERHQAERLPQRVDFLFVYQGKRHIVELDDIGHYGERRGREWIASEPQYRETLRDTRWLRKCGFEVHRFTNEEILELYNPDSSIEADLSGFAELLQAEGLNLDDMVLQDSHEST